MITLTMQTAHLVTHLHPARAALIDCVQIHAVHLPVHSVVRCPTEIKYVIGTQQNLLEVPLLFDTYLTYL